MGLATRPPGRPAPPGQEVSQHTCPVCPAHLWPQKGPHRFQTVFSCFPSVSHTAVSAAGRSELASHHFPSLGAGLGDCRCSQHSHLHTLTLTDTHFYTHTFSHILSLNTHALTHSLSLIYAHTHTHIPIHNTHFYTLIHSHTHVLTHIHSHTHVCSHTHTLAHTSAS